jgi:hypothetical protein
MSLFDIIWTTRIESPKPGKQANGTPVATMPQASKSIRSTKKNHIADLTILPAHTIDNMLNTKRLLCGYFDLVIIAPSPRPLRILFFHLAALLHN